MEPLGRRILYFRRVSASTRQRPFTITPASLRKLLYFTVLSNTLNIQYWTIYRKLLGHLLKNYWAIWAVCRNGNALIDRPKAFANLSPVLTPKAFANF